MIATFADEPYRGAVLGQRDRALPGRRAHLDPVPLRGAGPGRSRTSRPSAGSARSAATSARRRARAGSSGSSRATTPRSTAAGSATRAASPTRTCAPPTGSPIRCGAGRTAASRRSTGTEALDEAERLLRARRRGDPDGALGLRDRRAGLRRSPSSCASASARTRRVLPEEVPDELDCLPRAALVDPRRAGRRRPLRRAGQSSGHRSSTSGSRPPGATARSILTELARDADRGRRPDHRRRADAPPGSPATSARRPPSTSRARRTAAASPTPGAAPPTASRPTASRRSSSSPATRPPLDPGVRALAARADTVIGIGMFEDSFRGLADLVLPGTSYLERDGTTVNLEGRLQRQRRAVIAPCPDELAWIAKLAERFERRALAARGGRLRGGLGDLLRRHLLRRGRRAGAPPAAGRGAAGGRDARRRSRSPRGSGLRLLTYRPLFSGPAVERTPELDFQRRSGEVELSPRRRARAQIAAGDEVTVRSNGTSRRLRARIAARPAAGERPHAAGRRRRPARARRGDAGDTSRGGSP